MGKLNGKRDQKLLLSLAIAAWIAVPCCTNTSVVQADGIVHVTANRAQEEAKYNSQHVIIITKKDIEDKQAKSVEDIIFNEVGVSRSVDAMGRVGVSIRGAEPRHTLILVDGQPVMGDLSKYQGAGDELQRIGTENVDHIEVIQGAGSAKYGSDAIGGVINVITNKPRNKAGIQVNVEGVREKGYGDIAPFTNIFMRADSGKMGKVKVNVFGSKRDIMPIYASRERRSSFLGPASTDHGFLKNSLRYYGTNANIGVASTIDLNKDNAINVKIERFQEDLERYVKRSDSFLEPQVHYKRDLNRNTMSLSYTGKDITSNWKAEVNYTRTNENDLTLTSDYGNSTYEGKNTLNYVDNIDHRQWNVSFSGDIQHNDNHLISYGVGMSKESGSGSRLKNAPSTYVRKLDPWDYDKSLAVKRGIPSSTVYNYSFANNEAGIAQWNKAKEWYNGDETDASTIPQFTYEDYLQFADPSAGLDSAAVKGLIDGPTTRNSLKNRNPQIYAKYQEFARTLATENADFLAERERAVRAGEIDPSTGLVYTSVDRAYLPSYYYGAVEGFDASQIKFNGAAFKEEYNKRVNEQTVGSADIKKQYAYVQDTWQLNKNTILAPILRLDHSDLFGSNLSFNVGVTHNLNGNSHRRLKANVGTSYTEPGMGELYYNWEMYGSNITNATIGGGEARLGWYWVGNPDLKPEKSFNFDISLEGENRNTYSKVSVFRNRIKDYMTAYNTGYLMDFFPQYNENSALGAAKFAHAPDMIYSFKNIGKAEITGLEWELKQKLSSKWKMKFGYTYLHAVNKSNPDMPRQLLDKPTHKVGIGIDYEDKKSGWSGSLWGDYYIRMLDSNSVSGGGNYLASYIDPTNPDRSVITYSGSDRRTSDMYERKTFGIWNFIAQKQINEDAKVYFGINNLFNHRDDDRALSTRQFRFGVNLKFGSDGSKKAISSVTINEGKEIRSHVKNYIAPFITRPFDATKEEGLAFIGDYRTRWDSHLGFDRPSSRITSDSVIDEGASKNLRDEAAHGMKSRIRVGVEARVGKNTDIRVLGSASGQSGVDTSHEVEGAKGLSKQRLDEATITQHTKHWDFSAGRMTEEMGVTGYWFGKEYDGVRAIWTNGSSQVRVGYGDFRHSTGIEDSAYTHAVYDSFKRAPTVDEFLGTKLDASGSRVEDILPVTNDTVGFYQQLKAIKEEEKAAIAAAQDSIQSRGASLQAEIDTINNRIASLNEESNDIIERLYDWDNPLSSEEEATMENRLGEISRERNALRAELDPKEKEHESLITEATNEVRLPYISRQFDVVKRMQQVATQAYGKEMSETMPLELPTITVGYTYKEYEVDDWGGETGNVNFVPKTVQILPGALDLRRANPNPLFQVSFNESSLLNDGGREYLRDWFRSHKDEIIQAYRNEITPQLEYFAGKDSFSDVTLDESQFDALEDQFIRLNTVNDISGQRGKINVSGSDSYPYLISTFFNRVTTVLNEADHNSPLPREALGNYTGLVIPTEGVILKRDVIPRIKRAGFIQYRQEISPKVGVSAWYLRSLGNAGHTVSYANGNGTEQERFDRLANVFGIGLRYQIGHTSAVSFDYGQNRTDFGRFMNGGSLYEYVGGNRQFAVAGHRQGGTPHFWTLRFDVGKSDYNQAGSWNAFVDYKYFAHGSFFGGNGTGAVPDRYLDGVRSFTVGGGYVPCKDFLLEAFYTFDAKGIGQRDTLYGAENFKLGNYTRIQGTYKF